MTTATVPDVERMTREQIESEIDELSPTLKTAWEEAGPSYDTSKITVFGDLDTRGKSTRLVEMRERLEKLRPRLREIEKIEEEKRRIEEDEERKRRPVGRGPTPTDDGKHDDDAPEYHGLAELFTQPIREKMEDPEDAPRLFKSMYSNAAEYELDLDGKAFVERELKTIMSTGAGFAPQAIRSGAVIPAAFQRPTVIDLVPIVRTNQNAYVFMRQTTRTNNAAEVAESAQGSVQTYAESAFAWTEVSETIRKIAHFVPVTDEQLEDIEGMLDLISNDMRMGVRQRLSSQLLNGDGTAPNIEGFLDAGRSTNSVDSTGMNLPTAISEAIEDCAETGFVEADGVVCRTSDWMTWERETTADGIFINGHPSMGGPRTSWGLPVVTTTEISAGSALVGDFAGFSRLAVKRGVEVRVSSEHGTYFINGLQAVKAEMRATLAVLRESAFTVVSNIGS